MATQRTSRKLKGRHSTAMELAAAAARMAGSAERRALEDCDPAQRPPPAPKKARRRTSKKSAVVGDVKAAATTVVVVPGSSRRSARGQRRRVPLGVVLPPTPPEPPAAALSAGGTPHLQARALPQVKPKTDPLIGPVKDVSWFGPPKPADLSQGPPAADKQELQAITAQQDPSVKKPADTEAKEGPDAAHHPEWVSVVVNGKEYLVNLVTNERLIRASALDHAPFKVLTKSDSKPKAQIVETAIGPMSVGPSSAELVAPPQRTARPRLNFPRPRMFRRR